MNLRMAHGARLILGALVMNRSYRLTCRSVHIGCMTPQAQEVDVVYLQQPRIGRAMGRVAVQATVLGLHRSVLEDEWTHGVGVALGADRELAGCGSHLVAHLRPMWIVAVAALDESGVNAVAVGPREFRLLGGMASIAQFRLLFHQQEVNVGRFVRTVTRRATDAVRQVRRLGKVLRLQAGLVALRTDGCGLRRTQLLEANDLGGVAAAFHMRLRWAVAALASMLIAL